MYELNAHSWWYGWVFFAFCFLLHWFHSFLSISPYTQPCDLEHFSFPAPANPPLQRIRSTSTPNVHMVSTTAPMDSSLMQVGAKETMVGSNRALPWAITVATSSLWLLLPPLSSLLLRASAPMVRELPTPACTLNSLCLTTRLAFTHNILYNHSCW